MLLHAGTAILVLFNRKTDYVTPKLVFYVSAMLISIGNIIGEVNGLLEGNINSYMRVEHIPRATLIWCVGAASIFLGYEMSGKKSMPSVRLDVGKGMPDKMFNYVLVISVFYVQLSEMFAFLGTFAKLFHLFGVIGILFYFRLGGEKNSLKYNRMALLLAVLQTLIAIKFSYLRNAIIIPTIIMAVGYFVGKRHVKYAFSYRLIPYMVVIALFLTIFEDLSKHREDFSLVISEKLSEGKPGAAEEMIDLYDDEDYSGTFLERTAVVAQLSNVVELVEKHGYYEGFVSAPMVVALVPRFLWPDKPQIKLGQWFAVETETAYITESGQANNSINMTIMGEMYLDFGWIGVLIGCILYGMFMAVLWNSVEFFASPYNLLGILFGGYILVFSFGIGADLQIVVSYLSTYLIIYAIKKLITVYLFPNS
jgi:hypothetical protein